MKDKFPEFKLPTLRESVEPVIHECGKEMAFAGQSDKYLVYTCPKCMENKYFEFMDGKQRI